MAHAMRSLVCLALFAGCAPRPWIAVSPDALDRGPPVEAATVRLHGGTEATLVGPRREGARIVGQEVSRCAGAWCPTIHARNAVPTASVEAIWVWYLRPPPAVRVDVELAFPSMLVPLGAGVRAGPLGAGAGLRVATRVGFGGHVRFSGAGSLGTNYSSVETAHAEGWFLDLAALYRWRPVGDDRVGMGVDLSVGVSAANVSFERGHSAYADPCGWISFGGNCNRTVAIEYTSPPQSFSTGERVGPSLGLSLDGRIRALVFGVSATYRALVYTGDHRIAAEPAALSVLTVAGYAGVGFTL